MSLNTISLKSACQLFNSPVIILLTCNGPSEKKESNIDRSKLGRQQKRLPENSLNSLKVVNTFNVLSYTNEGVMTNLTHMDIDRKEEVWITRLTITT